MALNEIHRDGVSIPYPVASTIVSGDIVVLPSGLVGVAETDAKVGENGSTYYATVRHDGVFGFTYGSAATAGALLYVSSTPSAGLGVLGTLTATATSNNPVGTVTRAKGSGSGTVYINLNRFGRVG